MRVRIKSTFTTDLISSGSGISVHDGAIYIVGDDSDHLRKFSLSGQSIQVIKFNEGSTLTRIEKADKKDLESSVIVSFSNKQYLLAFGSGSLGDKRDSLLTIGIADEKITMNSIRDLYASFRLAADIRELNIEGAVAVGNKLLLFNRSTPVAFRMELDDFMQYALKHSLSVPDFDILNVSGLPVSDEALIGISGASALNDNTILFTASVEATSNAVDDGEISASYIGLMKVHDASLDIISAEMLDVPGMEYKLESIDVIEASNDVIKAVAVADNDDGRSTVFLLEITEWTAGDSK